MADAYEAIDETETLLLPLIQSLDDQNEEQCDGLGREWRTGSTDDRILGCNSNQLWVGVQGLSGPLVLPHFELLDFFRLLRLFRFAG